MFLQNHKTSPTFTDLTELVAAIKPPSVPSHILDQRARLFDYHSDDDYSDVDEIDFDGGRGGTVSDQEIADNEYLSGLEEGGYEV